MAKKQRNRTRDYIVYLIVRLFVAVIQMLSPRISYAVADGCAWLVYKIFKSRRRIAMENIQASFPEFAANPAAADRLVRGMYRLQTREVDGAKAKVNLFGSGAILRHVLLAQELLATKYQGWSEERPLSSWASGSLPVEVAFD